MTSPGGFRLGSSMKGKIEYYLLELPFILILIVFGFLMEFLIEAPFIVMCTLDRFFSQRKKRKLLSDQPNN